MVLCTIIMKTEYVHHHYFKFGIIIAGLCSAVLASMYLYKSTTAPNTPQIEIHQNALCPVFSGNQQPEQERIARHFAEDTLPGLIKMGLIKKYRREPSGMLIAVDGKTWKRRSLYFKQCLLQEVAAYNTFHGYEIQTKVIDSTSGILYAQISPPAKIDYFD